MDVLTDKQGKQLVQLARATIEYELGGKAGPEPDLSAFNHAAFQEQRGVFVTLHKREVLRGCIGSLVGVESIVDGVQRHAKNAAFHDHRFKPVDRDEAAELDIEVSVLTKPTPLQYQQPLELLELLRPERDGVVLKAKNGARATFLPQVWRQLPDHQAFLSHLCKKAGLSETAWMTEMVEVQVYQVHSFKQE